MLLLCLIVVVIGAVSGLHPPCPNFTPSQTCTCQAMKDKTGEEFSLVSCHNLHSEEALARILVACKELPIFELELVDCSFRYLPHDAFEGTTIEVLSIRNSSIVSLSDSNVAFEGLHNRLHFIEIINCTFVSSWDWTQLSKLGQLMEIHVSDSELIHVTDGLASIQHLDIEAFVFHRNKIQDIADNAFAPFENLERLALDNNYISKLKRSMFPEKAKKFSILGLSYNQLQDLPEDLFTNMPALKSLYLTGNPMVTLDEKVFRPIWNNLRLFLFYATRLSCDCRIAWLIMVDNSRKYLHAECYGPSNFKGRLLEGIKPNELMKC